VALVHTVVLTDHTYAKTVHKMEADDIWHGVISACTVSAFDVTKYNKHTGFTETGSQET
jgi:hypothetical protein